MGNVSDHLEFFFEKPFPMVDQCSRLCDGRGRAADIAFAQLSSRIAGNGWFPGDQSYLLWYRCDKLLDQYYPSYILVNGQPYVGFENTPTAGR